MDVRHSLLKVFSLFLFILFQACSQAAFYRIHNSQIRQFSSLFLPRYNSKEQKQILQILNESTAEEMSR